MKNPIFIEFYEHLKCDCYKILNPWTEYKAHKVVLCAVDTSLPDKAKGYANQLAEYQLKKWMTEALEMPIR